MIDHHVQTIAVWKGHGVTTFLQIGDVIGMELLLASPMIFACWHGAIISTTNDSWKYQVG